MSELFGNSTLETDMMMRSFGIARAARKMEKELSKEVRDSLQSYADGVNDCADSMKILPLEYQITRNSFTKWEIADSLSFLKLINF